MKPRGVKITGIGPVTPAGIGRDAFWQGITESKSRVRVVSHFLEEAGTFIGAEVEGFTLSDYAPLANPKRVPRHTQFAIAAAHLALNDAGIGLAELQTKRAAVLVGAALMDFGTINKSVEIILRKGPVNGLPTSVSTASVSSIGGAISDSLHQSTLTMAFQSACCSGLDAVGHAAQLIRTGAADVAICGGTEAPIFFHPMLELRMAGLAPGNPERPETQCRPFDLWRTTGAIGEGACMLVLEPEESPRQAYAFVRGYAYATDTGGALCSGLAHAIVTALGNAGLKAKRVGAVSAWGPGHREIDAAETASLCQVFGDELSGIPVSSIKGAIGNPLGAAGAIQIAGAALGMRESLVLPTVNWEYPDPSCRLSLDSRARHVAHDCVLVNSHGVSGTNACLILSR